MTNRSVRTIAFAAAVVLSITVGGCKSDVTSDAGDVLANDSTLALEVLQATGDTQVSEIGLDSVVAAGLPLATPAPAAPSPAVSVSADEPAARRSAGPIATPVRKASRQAPRSRRATVNASAPRQRPATVRTVSSRSPESLRRPASIVAASPGGMWLIMPAGAVIDLSASQRVCSNSALPGDVFSAEVSEAVMRASGTIIPEGSTARAEVVSVGAPGDPRMEVRIRSILVNGRTYPVTSRVTFAETKKVRVRSGGGTASRVGASAAAGAVIGGILGRDVTSTVIGAATGAAAGGVLAGRSGTVARCLPDGARLTAELTEPLRVAMAD